LINRTYADSIAFKQALEQRIRNASSDGIELTRLRQRIVFDRLLARLFRGLGNTLVLKGGLTLELRLDCARATRDVDLALSQDFGDARAALQKAAAIDLGDYFEFRLLPSAAGPAAGRIADRVFRLRAEAILGGKTYGDPFGVDVVIQKQQLFQSDVCRGLDILSFAGIEPPTLLLFPIELHIAEKLHAYTLPRKGTNSRLKDLPDIALLAGIRPISSATLRLAIKTVFETRNSHPAPDEMPPPPSGWDEIYLALAEENRLRWKNIDTLMLAVRSFINPALAPAANRIWNPQTWTWLEI